MNPPKLTCDDFSRFFKELWGADCDPFPWQNEFARRLCEGRAPDFVVVPTGSGKTACLDAAVFALALQSSLPVAQRTQGRRIFFIVNRRVIVDEAYDRAGKICQKLREATPDSVSGRVAMALRELSGETDADPLARVQLRGGIYREQGWANSLLQPMIICSTVDQAGSRLLFRGYGVSPQARPIHAALVAQDSLLIIDEAHISLPFIQTLDWVKRYRTHQSTGGKTLQLPFQFIQMTATPPVNLREDQKIGLSPGDHDHPVLNRRLMAAKPASLIIETKAKGKAREEQMAIRLAGEADRILEKYHPRSIAIMVNRVATARAIAAKLGAKYPGQVALLIGRMRPFDRGTATEEIQRKIKTGFDPAGSGAKPLIVVSTQCLEVGADLDFDALVTEAASLDSLRQRFGRLNRGGRAITAPAVVVLPGDQELPAEKLDEAAPCDPIYGNAIPRTWHWLKGLTSESEVDFGISTMSAAIDSLRDKGGEEVLRGMLSPKKDAPILLPAYLDCWVQTHPAPAADPEVALFLHGPQREMTDVQVCWRGDLPEIGELAAWTDILSLCPPDSAECLPVPLQVFRNWFGSRGKFEDLTGDSVATQPVTEKRPSEDQRGATALVWRGPDDSNFIQDSFELRPGDTIILRVQGGGWESLGHIPEAPADPDAVPGRRLELEEIRRVDIAETAVASSKRRAFLRIHTALWPRSGASNTTSALFDLAMDPERDWDCAEIKVLLLQLLKEENHEWALTKELRKVFEHLSRLGVRLIVERYGHDCGLVLTTRALLPGINSTEAGVANETEAEALLEAAQPQKLCDHTEEVILQVEKALALLPLSAYRDSLIAAAKVHDWGKADPRFQALLRGTTPFAAMISEIVLAKSGSVEVSSSARRVAWQRAELPQGFRHEMLSVQMSETLSGVTAFPASLDQRELALHLIATHHGYARPFAPVVSDDEPPTVNLSLGAQEIGITKTQRLEKPSHALESGLTERFWHMHRRYGYWGVALLETVLRLSDQAASAHPSKFI